MHYLSNVSITIFGMLSVFLKHLVHISLYVIMIMMRPKVSLNNKARKLKPATLHRIRTYV